MKQLLSLLVLWVLGLCLCAEDTDPYPETPGNYDKPWPKSVTIDPNFEITVVSEKQDQYIYESKNYRFQCDVPLSEKTVQQAALSFEVTFELCRQLPLGIKRAHGAKGKSYKYPVFLYASPDSYYREGANPGTNSTYQGDGKNRVIAPLKTVGVERSGNKYLAKSRKDLGGACHSLTWQLTDVTFGRDAKTPWLTRGLCNYVKHLPYQAGKFMLKDAAGTVSTAVVRGTDRRGGYYNIGKEVRFPDLESYLKGESKSHTTSRNVLTLLVFTYFAHLDGKGDAANLRNMMKMLREDTTQEQILDVLLDGRSYKELSEDFAKAWRGKGIKIIYSL